MYEFKMPKLGADMDDGILLEWKMDLGDSVKKGDIVAVVETAKGAIDIESFVDGTVEKLVVQPGSSVEVGAVLAFFSNVDAAIAEKDSSSQTTENSAFATPTSGNQSSSDSDSAVSANVSTETVHSNQRRFRASPLARKLANKLGVELATVSGTGPDGAIVAKDIQAAAAISQSSDFSPSSRIPPTQSVVVESEKKRKLDMRETIAAVLSRSKREIPHYYLSHDIDVTESLEFLESWNGKHTVFERIIPALLFYKAIGVAATEFESINGTYGCAKSDSQDGNKTGSLSRFKPESQVNLGIAISLRGGGLIAPCLSNVPSKSASDLMAELKQLVRRARTGGLRSSELSNATLTVTNLGDRGVDSVAGVIYPPQVALVGIGMIRQRPWVVNGKIEVRSIVTFSLSADHRVSDGHTGALFLRRIEKLLQTPEKLI